MLYVLLLIPWQAGLGQDSLRLEPVAEIPAVQSALSLILFPKVIADAAEIRGFLRSESYASIRGRGGDLFAVDALFRRALGLSWNNTAEALLICTLATLDHRRVGVRLAGIILWFPLTGEFEEEFEGRVRSLPARLYADTPPEGDRDKLQHFFGSALLSYLFESRGPAERAAQFVEWGEELFVVGGAHDARDMRANLQGMAFGLALLDDLALLPSTYLTALPPQAAPPWEEP